LQAALQEVQQQYKETKEILVQEREAAKKAAEIAPVIKEVPVVDTELMNKIRDENDKLKVRELNTM
jgi:myosin-5